MLGVRAKAVSWKSRVAEIIASISGHFPLFFHSLPSLPPLMLRLCLARLHLFFLLVCRISSHVLSPVKVIKMFLPELYVGFCGNMIIDIKIIDIKYNIMIIDIKSLINYGSG